MDKNKKAVLPLRAATQEITALYHLDKDEVNTSTQNNLSMAKNQQGTPGNSAASQRNRILKHLQTAGPLTTLQARHLLDVMHPGMRICELRKAGYPITMAWVDDFLPEGNSHLVGKYVLSKTKQFSLLDLKGVRGVAA